MINQVFCERCHLAAELAVYEPGAETSLEMSARVSICLGPALP